MSLRLEHSREELDRIYWFRSGRSIHWQRLYTRWHSISMSRPFIRPGQC